MVGTETPPLSSVAAARARFDSVDELCVNALRCLAIDAVETANSGHPGLPLGASPMAYVLFSRFLRHNPGDPGWADRDRFVLSPGHGSALLYALLHLSGYDLDIAELARFRQLGSRTPGHPEFGLTPGVDATTGPLGQGVANAVGMAIAERRLAAEFNRPGHDVVAHRTFALVSDGDLMEGVAHEAISLAGHLGLGKLVCLYDSNVISLDGPTSQTFTEQVLDRVAACGWHVARVEGGDRDLDGIARALDAAIAETARPSLIEVRTTIGFGAPTKAGTSAAHGAPLGAPELAATKYALGWTEQAPFAAPRAAVARFRTASDRGRELESRWDEQFRAYRGAHPALAAEFERRMTGALPDAWADHLPAFEVGAALATRQASGACLQALAAALPELMGGDADLSTSTNTRIRDGGDFDASTGAGRNLHFGVREHAMAAIANGIAYHHGLRPYAATFFVFSDYLRPAARLAAISGLPVIHIWTHDSIGLGEDGTTHQPIEHLASFRAMPRFVVLRPADANETAVAWRLAISEVGGPTALVLTRQTVPTLDAAAVGDGPAYGAYILEEASTTPADLIVMASGSEVHLALAARAQLELAGVATRVVSFPSWELFERQSPAYREHVLPAGTRARIAVEAASRFGWDRYVGLDGAVLGLDDFGASAPAADLYREFGLTVEALVSLAGRVVAEAAPCDQRVEPSRRASGQR
jgi:transketolase